MAQQGRTKAAPSTPAAPSSSNKDRCYVSEDKIPATFNEVDVLTGPDEVLRNLFNFKLLDDDGNFMSFDELGQEDGRLGQVIGELVEPLPVDFRRKITDLCCTVTAQNQPPAGSASVLDSGTPLDSLQTLNNNVNAAAAVVSSGYDNNAAAGTGPGAQMVAWFETEKLYTTVRVYY